ncbi:anti-sigma factor [Cryobacterium ruanii]|uniref:Anti-sigma factor n=1 Tax=Cryobacterium ruanii TaxID=1259197 RepID=A0A4R9AMV7_9MICO|nr:anti-sigma factor [Cryobacterium ruanii]TFD65614.1 anti-sigma factor [Cryobacterium ruanii]
MIPTDRAHLDCTHIVTDDLHLLALAELDVSDRERTHLAACAACAGEYLALRQVVQLGRAAGPDRLLTPPGGVWVGIHAELALSEAVRTPLLPPKLRYPTDAATRPDASAADHAEPAAFAPVRRLPRRRWVPVAAAVGLIGLVGGIAIGVATTAGGAERVVAEAALDALPGWSASGSARVEEAADGRRSVVVDLDAPAGASLREVWLLKADASGLVSLGFLDGSIGRFTVPAGVDLTQYPLVDVSAEPADGDPAHSGDSIVRGELHTGS